MRCRDAAGLPTTAPVRFWAEPAWAMGTGVRVSYLLELVQVEVETREWAAGGVPESGARPAPCETHSRATRTRKGKGVRDYDERGVPILVSEVLRAGRGQNRIRRWRFRPGRRRDAAGLVAATSFGRLLGL